MSDNSRFQRIDVVVELHRETDKAVFASDTGNVEDAKWIPKSQIKLEPHKGKTFTMTLPEWLAQDKGFI